MSGDLPEERARWTSLPKAEAGAWLGRSGSEYEQKDLGDQPGKALIIKGTSLDFEAVGGTRQGFRWSADLAEERWAAGS